MQAVCVCVCVGGDSCGLFDELLADKLLGVGDGMGVVSTLTQAPTAVGDRRCVQVTTFLSGTVPVCYAKNALREMVCR